MLYLHLSIVKYLCANSVYVFFIKSIKILIVYVYFSMFGFMFCLFLFPTFTIIILSFGFLLFLVFVINFWQFSIFCNDDIYCTMYIFTLSLFIICCWFHLFHVISLVIFVMLFNCSAAAAAASTTYYTIRLFVWVFTKCCRCCCSLQIWPTHMICMNFLYIFIYYYGWKSNAII